jgi:hypothetical protein
MPGMVFPCVIGPEGRTGFMYSQTVSPDGVTSKNVPFQPLQISVLPLDRRVAPEMNGL